MCHRSHVHKRFPKISDSRTRSAASQPGSRIHQLLSWYFHPHQAENQGELFAPLTVFHSQLAILITIMLCLTEEQGEFIHA